jgi:hypothetical protein
MLFRLFDEHGSLPVVSPADNATSSSIYLTCQAIFSSSEFSLLTGHSAQIKQSFANSADIFLGLERAHVHVIAHAHLCVLLSIYPFADKLLALLHLHASLGQLDIFSDNFLKFLFLLDQQIIENQQLIQYFAQNVLVILLKST